MDKFGRNYKLTVATPTGGTVVIQPPFTLEFDIIRHTLSSANVCQIRVFNLSQQNRNKIRRNVTNYGDFLEVELLAGYGNNLARIFSGNISAAWSVREGVNFITQMECYDGGFAFVNGTSNQQFGPPNTQRDVIIGLMNDLPHTTVGAVGNYPDPLSRRNSYSGNTADRLRENTGGGFFIDGGKANALRTDEVIANAGGVSVISSASGLLETPVLEQTIVRFNMVFEPGLVPGQLITLESITEGNFNGNYKVTGVQHRGMISEAVCGSVITTGEFYYVKAPVVIPQ